MKAHLFGSIATSAMVTLLAMPMAAMAQTAGATSSPPPAPIDTAAPSTAAGPQAQTAPIADPAQRDNGATGTSSPSTGLADIIVTAQRRSENLQRAAIAVTAVTSAALTRAGVTDTTQLTRLVPALQIGNGFGPTNAFYVRGVGNFVTNSLGDSAIAFNVDGVNFARPTSAQGVLYDLERIEVLKGPQGTLYGRNATGGAINVITAKPRFNETSGYGTFEYGNYDSKKVNAAVNLPLGDKAALRVAGQYVDRDGNYSDGTGDDKRKAIRATFAAQPTDAIKLTVGADYEHQGGKGPGSTVAGLDKDDRVGVFDPRAQAIYAQSFAFGAGNTLHPLTVRDYYNHNNYYGIYAQADITTGIGTLTILPAYRRSDLNYRNYASSFAITEKERDEQASVEVRLTSDASAPLSYILGGYYLHESTHTAVDYDQQYFAGYSTYHPVTDSYAGFARLTYKVTDKLRISGGARYTVDDKKAALDSLNATVVCNSPIHQCPGTPALPDTLRAPPLLFAPNGMVIPFQPYGPGGAFLVGSDVPDNPSKKFRKPTYRAGVEYDVAPASLLYGSIETGFKSGGFYSSVADDTYRPETITAITLGSKNRFLNNRLQLNVELFHWIYKNQQISHFRTTVLPGGVAIPEFITDNVGKSRVQGVEVEGQARVGQGTTLNATVQYLDAKYQRFTYNNSAIVGPPTTGCPVTGPANGSYTVDCSGRHPSQAPKWTVTAGVEQRISLGSAGDLTFNANTRYQSKDYDGFEQIAAQIQKGYFMTDLQLTYTTPDGRFNIAGFVNNLENNNVVGFSSPNGQAPSLVSLNLRDPRTYGVRAGFKF